ncbi:hypothetical protein ABTY00_35710 [Streptomyces microflavus]|uniref:hypothetical protein n=1 Tax=Streptomyces microflavus TaxID=1919 RepID=UPI003319D7C8
MVFGELTEEDYWTWDTAAFGDGRHGRMEAIQPNARRKLLNPKRASDEPVQSP